VESEDISVGQKLAEEQTAGKAGSSPQLNFDERDEKSGYAIAKISEERPLLPSILALVGTAAGVFVPAQCSGLAPAPLLAKDTHPAALRELRSVTSEGAAAPWRRIRRNLPPTRSL
jgi:hypothetical protein